MLKLVLSQYEFGVGDYGKAVTFRLYDEDGSTPFNASSYTGIDLKVYRRGSEYHSLTPSWTTQNQGVGTFSFTQTKNLDRYGNYDIEIILTKTGEETASEPVRIVALKPRA